MSCPINGSFGYFLPRGNYIFLLKECMETKNFQTGCFKKPCFNDIIIEYNMLTLFYSFFSLLLHCTQQFFKNMPSLFVWAISCNSSSFFSVKWINPFSQWWSELPLPIANSRVQYVDIFPFIFSHCCCIAHSSFHEKHVIAFWVSQMCWRW